MCFKVDINSVGFAGYFTQKSSYISIIHLINWESRRLKILASSKINIEIQVRRDENLIQKKKIKSSAWKGARLRSKSKMISYNLYLDFLALLIPFSMVYKF